MKTKIFTYKGHIGAETDLEKGKFINNPRGEGQLGCVIDVKEIDITKDTVDILKNAKREGGSFASIMLTLHSKEAENNCESEASIGLMGFGKHFFRKDKISIGRACNTSVLRKCNIVEMEVPQDFKEFVDNL